MRSGWVGRGKYKFGGEGRRRGGVTYSAGGKVVGYESL